jgi:acyl-coenzyme A thioesterase PaaI-like protein
LVPRRFGLRREVTVSAGAPEVSTSASYDILSVDAVEERFGIQMLWYDSDGAAVARRMPPERGDREIVAATGRMVYVDGDPSTYRRPKEPVDKSTGRSLEELMAVTPSPTRSGWLEMSQHLDLLVLNASERVHGGVAATALKVIRSAASPDGVGQRFWSGLHVNFLRPCAAGRRSRYVARVAQKRSTLAVVEALALGEDGNTAVTARLTAYKTH